MATTNDHETRSFNTALGQVWQRYLAAKVAHDLAVAHDFSDAPVGPEVTLRSMILQLRRRELIDAAITTLGARTGLIGNADLDDLRAFVGDGGERWRIIEELIEWAEFDVEVVF